jgi:hypothetical protein
MARQFDRLRARCRLARDAITKRISFARVRRYRLPRIAEQVFDGLPIRRRQIRKRQLAATLEMRAAETGKAPDPLNLQTIHAFGPSRQWLRRQRGYSPTCFHP